MDREDRRDSRPPHHKRTEAKKKSRSLPPHNRQGGITVDHSAIFAAYEREERRLKDARKEPSSISSDTSCSSLEFMKPNEIPDFKQMAKDSRSFSDHRRSSMDSLSRKDRMEALKARVEAEREKYRESSSDEDEQFNRKLSRYYSDEAIHHVSRDHHKTRSARTERYLKRRSQDESTLWKLGSRRPPAGKTGKSWQESQSHSPLPIIRPKSKCESTFSNGNVPSHNRSVLMPLNVLTPSTHIETKPQQSPNDSGVSTQSIASSPSSGRAQSPKRCLIQETRSVKNDILSSKARLHNFSQNGCSRSSSDIRSEKSITSPLSVSPVPQLQPDMVHRCRRTSMSDAENCCNHMRAVPLSRMQWPDCCRSNRMCCSVAYRCNSACSPADTRKTAVYSYTDQAPKYPGNHNSHVKKMVSKIQMNGEDKIRLHQPLLAKPLVAKNNEIMSKSYETKMPQCPVHLVRSATTKTSIPLPNKTPEFHSPVSRLCSSASGHRSPPSPNCRPLSLVIDTLDYLTDPKNYTNCESVADNPKPSPPAPPIRKYHWTSTLNLNASAKMRLDAMKRTRNSLTSPECDYKVSDSDEIRSSNQSLQPALKSNARSSENLDQALRELEEIYKSLKLNDEDLAERAERRDLPTKHQLQYSSTDRSLTFSKSEETLQKKAISGSYDCLLVCNRPVRVRAPPFRRAGMSDKVTDDFAYRRFQRAITQNKEDKPEKSQSYLLCNSAFTPGLKVNEYYRDLTSKNQPDIERDDLSYRNYTQAIAARVSPPHPPFGIPLGPTVKSSSNSYLHASPSKPDNRPIYRSQETPDVVRDDMAYRNLRKDDANLHRQRRKHRAVRSLSANIAQLMKQKGVNAKDYTKAQSMTDIIVALEEQSSEWKNLSQLAKNEAIKSPESSSTDDSTPHCLNNLVSGTSDGLTLSESSSESTKTPMTKIQEMRTQPEGSECVPKLMDKETISKSSSLVDCCRLMSSNRESRKQKTMSVYQPSSSFRYPHDIWSDTDVKLKRKSIGLDESQLDALLTSLSRDTEQKKEEHVSLTKSSYGNDLRVTA